MCARPNPATSSAAIYIERTVTTSDGVRLAVRDYGPARTAEHTIVLLHGLCLMQSSWDLQTRELLGRWGSRLRVITYDHRGHGDSADAEMRTYQIDRLATDLAEVLTALRVRGPLTLAGHSMGGMTALAYFSRPAADRPVQPEGLVLIATAAGRLAERGLGRLLATPATGMLFDLVGHLPGRALAERAIGVLTKPMRDGIVKFSGYGTAVGVTASAIHASSLATAVGFLPSLKRYDEYATLKSIGAKTIVISGGADITTPVAHAQDMAAAIPGATHLHRPSAGHMLLQDESEVVTDAIDSVIGLCHRSVPLAEAA
jgi:pimeloyl-ACP methyl ester carboxylesterase